MPPVAAFMLDSVRERFFDAPRAARLKALTAPLAPILAESKDDLLAHPDAAGVKVIMTGWRSPRVTPDIKEALPNLALVAHCAGSLRSVADPELFDMGVRFTNCADANAIPVAEYLLSYILRWTKRLDWWEEIYRSDPANFVRRDVAHDVGAFDKRVGIIGASRVGRRLLTMLQATALEPVMYDPYLSSKTADALDVRQVSLQELLQTSDIVSINAPLLPETRGMIGVDQLAQMRDGALLINTARGGLIDHDALLAEAQTGRLHALLDVTEPEPLPADSPFFSLPNVVVTPHVAGSLGRELYRLADAALDEVELFLSEGRLTREVSRKNWKLAS